MSIWTEEQARAVLAKVVAQSKADECTATLTGGVRGNSRFALNIVTTSGVVTVSRTAFRAWCLPCFASKTRR